MSKLCVGGKQLYVVEHTHRHGTDFQLFYYVSDGQDVPDDDDVIRALGIDFEEDRDDEYLEISPWSESSIPYLFSRQRKKVNAVQET
jgi:hypothetical protein